MWSPQQWMRPLEAAPGVKVIHRIHLKIWQIETPEGVLVITLNWQTGEMVASLQEQAPE